MKRTLNINIGNSIIHIEEDAYEVLTVYLNEVKYHFSKNADDFEIVTDIENRIAEMFAEILAAQQKQIINIEDVAAVTRQMGSVKDFESSDEQESEYVGPGSASTIKKLYRDKDQAMIAGVCSGLAHYLDVDIRWVRLSALLTILLWGAGILAYVVLWIMIPKAATKSEKMAMYGQEANLRGFANNAVQSFGVHSQGFIAGFLEVIGNFIQGTGKIIFKAIAGGIVFFGSLFLLFLIAMLAALLGVGNANLYQYFPLNIVNEAYITTLTCAAFVVFAVPLLALVLFSVRVAFNSRAINKTLSFGLLIIWLAGVVVSIFYIAKISSEFKEGAEFAQTEVLKPYPAYYLTVNRGRFFTKEDSLKYNIDAKNYVDRKILNDLDDNFNIPRNISLSIEKSGDNKIAIIENYSARGANFETALKNAQNIHYEFIQKDSLLNFSPVLQFIKNASWRSQRVNLILKVPVGTVLNVDQDFSNYMGGYNYWDCEDKPNSPFRELVMTDSGLKCKYERAKEPESENN